MMWGEMSFGLVTFAGALVSSLNRINQVFLRIFSGVSLRCRLSVFAIGGPQSETEPMPGHYRDEFGQGQGTDARRDNIL
jgi:hypothetical protein